MRAEVEAKLSVGEDVDMSKMQDELEDRFASTTEEEPPPPDPSAIGSSVTAWRWACRSCRWRSGRLTRSWG